ERQLASGHERGRESDTRQSLGELSQRPSRRPRQGLQAVVAVLVCGARSAMVLLRATSFFNASLMDNIQPVSTEELRSRLVWDMAYAPLSREQLLRIIAIVNE